MSGHGGTGHASSGAFAMTVERTVSNASEQMERARKEQPELFAQKRGRNKWASQSPEETAKELGSDVNKGLQESAIRGLQDKYGQNLLGKEEKEALWKIYLHEFQSPVVLMLCTCCIVTAALGEFVESIAIFLIVNINATIATYTERSCSNALAALAAMAAPDCEVIRGGRETKIPASELVPGDVVKLTTGVSVPADCRLITCSELKTNEAPLTGESEDVRKMLVVEDVDEPFAKNMCFASTCVSAGTGMGIVTTIGMETQVGRIAQKLKDTGRKLTPLQLQLNRLGGQIGALSATVLVVVIIIAYLRGVSDPTDDRPLALQLMILGVGFAVSSIPEGLPMVVTICLSLGCQDMVRRNALVRKLPAVETLGSCSVICSDKTGTLTEGKMTVTRMATFVRPHLGGLALDEEVQAAERTVEEGRIPYPLNAQPYDLFPTKGFDPNGGVFSHYDLKSKQEKQILARYDVEGQFGKFDEFCDDYGDPNGKVANTMEAHGVRTFLVASYLNSHTTKLCLDKGKADATGKGGRTAPTPAGKTNRDPTAWFTAGNMSEGAIVVACAKGRVGGPESAQDFYQLYPRNEMLEIPFSSSRKMAASVHALPQGRSDRFEFLKFVDGEKYTHIAVVKGAPDRLLNHTHYLPASDKGTLVLDCTNQLQPSERHGVQQVNDLLSEKALRVLCVCVRPLTQKMVQELSAINDGGDRLDKILSQPASAAITAVPRYTMSQGGAEQKDVVPLAHDRDAHVGALTLLGLFGSMDPAREGARRGARVPRCGRARHYDHR